MVEKVMTSLDGGVGNDFLAGGAGEDTFFFEKGSGYDVIEDFRKRDRYN